MHGDVQSGQTLNGGLTVPQGGGVRVAHHDGPVGGAGGQPEAGAHTGGAVDDTVVERFPHLAHQAAHSVLVHTGGEGDGGGDEVQVLKPPVDGGGLFQTAPTLNHVGEIHQGLIGHAEGQVQVAQADVCVDAEGALAHGRKAGGNACGGGGLSGASLAGGDDDGCADAHGLTYFPNVNISIIPPGFQWFFLGNSAYGRSFLIITPDRWGFGDVMRVRPLEE